MVAEEPRAYERYNAAVTGLLVVIGVIVCGVWFILRYPRSFPLVLVSVWPLSALRLEIGVSIYPYMIFIVVGLFTLPWTRSYKSNRRVWWLAMTVILYMAIVAYANAVFFDLTWPGDLRSGYGRITVQTAAKSLLFIAMALCASLSHKVPGPESLHRVLLSILIVSCALGLLQWGIWAITGSLPWGLYIGSFGDVTTEVFPSRGGLVRISGLAFEPRGLGVQMALAVGILIITYVCSLLGFWKLILGLSLSIATGLVTYSRSAFVFIPLSIILSLGLVISFMGRLPKQRIAGILALVGGCLLTVEATGVVGALLATTEGAIPAVEELEDYDAAVVEMFRAMPLTLLLGVGPGMDGYGSLPYIRQDALDYAAEGTYEAKMGVLVWMSQFGLFTTLFIVGWYLRSCLRLLRMPAAKPLALVSMLVLFVHLVATLGYLPMVLFGVMQSIIRVPRLKSGKPGGIVREESVAHV